MYDYVVLRKVIICACGDCGKKKLRHEKETFRELLKGTHTYLNSLIAHSSLLKLCAVQ